MLPVLSSNDREETKGRFRRRVVLANVLSSRFLVLGNIQMYPRAGSWYRGASAKTTLLATTLLRTPEKYDWTTGVLDNGNEWRKFRAIPRLYPLRSLVCTLSNKGGSRGALDYQGRAGIISIVRWNLRPVIFGVDFSES